MLIFLPSALLSKEQRMTYDYHFNNETISIDIPDSDYEVLIEMDRLEYNANHKETRRHMSLEACDRDDNQLPDKTDVEEICIQRMEIDALQCAMDRLLPKQRELIQKIFFENQTITSLARLEGVGKSAICERLNRALERLKISLK